MEHIQRRQCEYGTRHNRGRSPTHSRDNHVRKSVESIRADTTTPDTRLADTVMDFNPASVTALVQLMEGGLYIQHP
ncbi:MAG TPA: hypothetical protein VF730_11940, partial [Terracidiphilus sp.]